MNKIKILVGSLVAVVLLGVGGLWFVSQNNTSDNIQQSSSSESSQQTDEEILSQNEASAEKLEITTSEDGKTVSYQGQDGKTALEILKNGAEVATEESSFGEFVTGINGVLANSDSEYWSFYVDGAYAQEGAGTYQTKDTERIEWKLEAL